MQRHRMDALFHFDKLSYAIEFDVPNRSTTDSPGKDWEYYDQWEYDNKQARHLLLRFISDELVKQFDHLSKPKQIYNQVIERYYQSTNSHLMEAFRAYVNYRMA